MADETKKLQQDPPEGSREVVDRELNRDAKDKTDPKEWPEDQPDPTNTDKLDAIQPVDLALHSDGISHWQDEPEDSSERDNE